MKRYLSLVFVALLTFTACNEEPVDPIQPTDAEGASMAKAADDGGIDLKDRYIVVFKDEVGNPNELTDQLMRGKGGKVHFRYEHALKGFAATIPAEAVQGISRNPNVDYIEADGLVHAGAIQYNPPSWGLDRIDETTLPMDGQYSYPDNGSDVTVYIIDSGIRFNHVEFGTRATSGYDFIDNDPNADDCHGHGTHVAGTVGGTNVGVAKGVDLVAVRVLNCQGSGSYSAVIAGINWVTANHSGPSVANMSLGGGYSSSLNQAVNNSVAAGVTYAVSAGNSNANACNYSPASASGAICVASSTSSDYRSSFSNYGSCVDIFAPGSGIYSSTMNSTSSYASWSGTSMASPHVAGVAAIYLDANPGATTTQVRNAILAQATSGVLQGNLGSGSPNLLLNNQFGGPTLNPPAAPSNLSATAASSSQINLAWTDNANNEDGFRIERSPNGSSSWSQIAQLPANTTSYQNAGLSAGTTYYYRARAYNGDGNSAYSNTDAATTFGPPAAPGNFNANATSSSAISLSWTDNASNESGYVLRWQESGGSWTTVNLAANSTSYPHSGLSASTTYNYELYAENSYGSSATVTTSESTPAAATQVHVGATNFYKTVVRNSWHGTVDVTVHDNNDNTVAGVTVHVSWSGDANGSATAVTNSNGVATILTDKLNKKKTSVTLTVTNLSGANVNYVSGSNHATLSGTVTNP